MNRTYGSINKSTNSFSNKPRPIESGIANQTGNEVQNGEIDTKATTNYIRNS